MQFQHVFFELPNTAHVILPASLNIPQLSHHSALQLLLSVPALLLFNHLRLPLLSDPLLQQLALLLDGLLHLYENGRREAVVELILLKSGQV